MWLISWLHGLKLGFGKLFELGILLLPYFIVLLFFLLHLNGYLSSSLHFFDLSEIFLMWNLIDFKCQFSNLSIQLLDNSIKFMLFSSSFYIHSLHFPQILLFSLSYGIRTWNGQLWNLNSMSMGQFLHLLAYIKVLLV